MTNSKSTKKALLASVFALVVCFAMLVGSTFAWFTDSASTSVNTIKSGTLDVDLLGADGKTVVGKTLEFKKAADAPEGEKVRWEPGCTYELEPITIVNNGNLALKYKIILTGINGDAELNKAIDWTIQMDGTDADLSTFESYLLAKGEAGDKAVLTIKGHMKETAGNEYQNLKITGISIKVVATQYTHEYDSSTDQYDAGAVYPAATDAEIAEKLESAQPGDTVTVASGSYKLPASVAGNVTISGEGADKTVLKVPATPDSSNKKTGLVIDQPGVTISDAEVARSTFLASNEYYGFIDIREGGTTLDGIKIDRTYGNTSAVVIKGGVDEGETVRIANSNLRGDFKTIDIVDGANGTIEIDNTEINGIYTFNVNSASSQNLVVNVTNSKLHGWTSYGDIKSASFTDTEFSMGVSGYDYLRPYADTTLTNCTFDGEFMMGSGSAGKTYVFTNCTYKGAALTAENIHNMFDQDDIEVIKACTITVDGTAVVFN